MINFRQEKYQLFFSNNLEPLRALNYADELFFDEFERFCGFRYRILSVIRKGWQEKYGLLSDIENLQKNLEQKMNEENWITDFSSEYEEKKERLVKTLNEECLKNYSNFKDEELGEVLIKVRKQSASLDAMSNLLHLFSSLVGTDFVVRLKKYSQDIEEINKNFIYYTQPIKESEHAKLLILDLPNKFLLSKQDQVLSSILRAGAYIKDDVSTLLEERGVKLESLFKEIAVRLSLDVKDLYYVSVNEIKVMLISGKPDRQFLDDRKNITVLFYPEKHLEIYQGEGAESFLKDGGFSEIPVRSDESFKAVELKGQVASLGKATGRVVVVKNSDEANKLISAGDILVAPYTAPEYLLAMKKAAAVITETGGITSHAAIVSRELKIPCVIGVPDVMSILSTGDLVEVDADNGVVRKL